MLRRQPNRIVIRFLFLLLLVMPCSGSVVDQTEGSESALDDGLDAELLHHDDFSSTLENWTAEIEAEGTIAAVDGKLDISTHSGSTLWFNQKLSQPVVITYDVTTLADGRDGLPRDHNLFWMAFDPDDPAVRPTGNGGLGDYDRFDMYYAGIGGNKNKTTRFRRYRDSDRVLIKEYTDKAHLNAADQTYHMKIVCIGDRVQVFRDGQLYWDFTDSSPYTEGWFGFRQTRTHLQFDDFKVYSLQAKAAKDH